MPTRHLFGFLAMVSGLVGCGSTQLVGNTTTTAADVEAPASAEGGLAPVAREASYPSVLAGTLVCRTKSASDGMIELYVDAPGDVAKGTLRRVAPSGIVYLRAVRTERYKGTVYADEPSQTDLVAHAAVVAHDGDKLYMKAGDAKALWHPCQ